MSFAPPDIAPLTRQAARPKFDPAENLAYWQARYAAQGMTTRVVNGVLYTYAGPSDMAAARIGSAGIPREFSGASFETFDIPTEHHRQLRNDVRHWCERLRLDSRSHTGLVLTGTTGTGKTHLAVSALRDLAGRGRTPRFFTFSRMLVEFRAGFDGMGPEYFADDCDALLIDDFMLEKPTESLGEKIKFILFERLTNFRPTIITANLPFPGAASKFLGDALCSRIRRDYLPLRCDGLGDFREEQHYHEERSSEPPKPLPSIESDEIPF